jgi:hypothetical protein
VTRQSSRHGTDDDKTKEMEHRPGPRDREKMKAEGKEANKQKISSNKLLQHICFN